MQKLFQNIKRSLLIFTLIFTISEFIQDKRIKRSQQTMERRIQVFLTEKIRGTDPTDQAQKESKEETSHHRVSRESCCRGGPVPRQKNHHCQGLTRENHSIANSGSDH